MFVLNKLNFQKKKKKKYCFTFTNVVMYQDNKQFKIQHFFSFTALSSKSSSYIVLVFRFSVSESSIYRIWQTLNIIFITMFQLEH